MYLKDLPRNILKKIECVSLKDQLSTNTKVLRPPKPEFCCKESVMHKKNTKQVSILDGNIFFVLLHLSDHVIISVG